MADKLNTLFNDILNENLIDSKENFESVMLEKISSILEKKKQVLYGDKNKEKEDDDDLDSVDKSELKGKHADRDDKDIDNDGDVDDSDKFLHKKRKAISKAMKKEDHHDDDEEDGEQIVCPKCDGDGCPHCDGRGYHIKGEE
tara:strand:+ start:285 stop:710 length:426 start_codon:yes stop_codon:yes gene_type:complete